MSHNTFGHLFRVTTWGESHGPAIGCTVDGCPPGVSLSETDIQPWLDKRKPGQNKFTTQRKEPDEVRILSGTFEGKTTGTPIQLMIENTDQRSKDYGEIAQSLPPRPCRHHLSPEIWHPRLSRRRAVQRARDRKRVAAAGVARRCWRRWCPG
jgi:chorismate synthase